MKIFVVGNQFIYGRWLSNNLTSNIEESDLVVFTGGEDVDPTLYDEKPHRHVKFNTDRDLDELMWFNEAVRLNKPILAICRGSQLMCVTNGGKLIQHVTGHGIMGKHEIIDVSSKKIYNVTSTHHQMAYPFNIKDGNYEIIAHSNKKLSEVYYKNNDKEYPYSSIKIEPEIIFYPKTKCLGIQYHPEYMDQQCGAVIYTKNLINKYLFNSENKININFNYRENEKTLFEQKRDESYWI